MYYYFGDATPKHLRFKIITYDGLKEAGDIRLVDIKEGDIYDRSKIDESDSVFFRFGFFEFIRLNLENMVEKYEAARWYDVDIIIDWDKQGVSIYINDDYITSTGFFHKDNHIEK